MYGHLRSTANGYGEELDIRTIKGEEIHSPDHSVDSVISRLILCTVENPKECLIQIWRILRPNGHFLFIEPVRARENSIVGFIQNLIQRTWHWFFEGCHTDWDTATLLEFTGFSKLRVDKYNHYSPFVPIIPQI